MPNLSVLLAATLSVTDTTLNPSATIITRNFNNPTLAVTQDAFANFYQIGTVLVAIPFPPGVTVIYVAHVKNLHATNNLLVTVTPNGGASSNVGIVGPGGIWEYFQTTETAGTAISGITNGLTALSLTASAASTSVEVLLAA